MAPSVDEAADLLAQLVACPSVNPARRRPDGPPFGEGAMADLLAGLLAGWGAEVRKVRLAPGRWNFLARFEGADAGRSLMLEAHADTVSADDMAIPPFEPAIRDGRLYGRGSCDCKASMAAMLLGIRSVMAGGRLPATVWFVATGDEELGSTGAHRLMADGFRPDAAIVGEPTDLAAVHAHKGAYRCRITTRGRAAHSSDPSRGVNAIGLMARVIEAINGPLAERLAQRGHPLLGSPTVSVGTIRGGSQVNVVPGRCEIEVDRRTLPGETRDALAAEFRAELDALQASDARFQYAVEELEWYPAMEEDPQGPLARLVGGAMEAVLGRARFKAVPWASNAGVFRQAGIPSLLFGPGSIRQAHTAEEYVELAEVVQAAQVYAEILRRF